MKRKQLLTPDYIFESSWEVCNKVGGIYTVLSTRAKTLQGEFPDRIIFIGPDVWIGKENPSFQEDERCLEAWREQAMKKEGLKVRVGRWKVPGEPIAVLVDFTPFYAEKDKIYTQAWQDFGVDSLHAYGDYDEASMFSYAAGKVVESYYRYALKETDRVVYHANEWMTGLGALYVQKAVPEIATIFTTHATSIGRSIAGNNKELYAYFEGYHGDQMARELNMESKHSIEKQTAHHVDCFTTVSEITDRECKQLLEKPADVILMNGFEDDFVPQGEAFVRKREEARACLLKVASKLLGRTFEGDTLIVGTSGRYEFKNKGIDVYLDALGRLAHDTRLKRRVLALICVPAWVSGPREDLAARMQNDETSDAPLQQPFITHWLHNMNSDQVLSRLRTLNLLNAADSKVDVVFIPCYLDGNDGILNETYYNLIVGGDLNIYPSYYEPWGYTPLESIAFQVPTITTDLAGFGAWVNSVLGREGDITDGVEVLHRTDDNYAQLADTIEETIIAFASKSNKEVNDMRHKAASIAEKALWKHFIKYYYQAYDFALRRAKARVETQK